MKRENRTWWEQIEATMTELSKLSKDMETVAGRMSASEIERMKNCVNCDHSEVCLVVAQRKARKANDYTPCSKWKLVEK